MFHFEIETMCSKLLFFCLCLHLFVLNFCSCHYFRNSTTGKPMTPHCGANEVYSPCGNNGCQNTCKNPILSHLCKGPCIPGCICKEGFLLDDSRKCIPFIKCKGLKCSGPNEEFVKCPNPCPGGTCEQPNFSPCRKACLLYGCQCKAGYLRDENMKCVPISECPCSGQNEVFVKCPNPCPGGTCDQPDFFPCRKACLSYGCQCKPGYVRDENGKCIPFSDCHKCATNEVWEPCPHYCSFETTCYMLIEGIWPVCLTPSSILPCKGKCVCKTGYVRHKGKCVTQDICCTDANSELVMCPNPCPGGTCELPEFLPCDLKCDYVGCQCKEGFVKDSNGLCIPLSDCAFTTMVTCGPNEIWNPCARYCSFDMSCERLLYQIIRDCPPPPPNWRCSGKCECMDGFVRINGSCLPPDECCNDPNATLVDCPNPCPGGTCLQPFFSECDVLCRPQGCQCKEGFVKNSTGSCVSLNSCDPQATCPENEILNKCPNSCDPEVNCDEYIYGVVPPSCDNITTTSACGVPRCECIKPFARNRDGICVHPDKCCFDPNSEVVENPVCCPGKSCCPGMSCIHPGKLRCNQKCDTKGCQCKPGYLRLTENNDVCVLPKECPTSKDTTTGGAGITA